MIFSASPFASIPFSWTPDDYSIASPFSALIADQDADRVYLLHCQPYDPVTQTVVDVRFSKGLERPILNGFMWPSRIASILNMETRLFGEAIGAGGSSSFGVIKLLIGDRENDPMLRYEWDGRPFTLYMGGKDFSFSEFEPVAIGSSLDIEYDLVTMTILIRDKTELLNVDIQETVYAGTGGLEGGEDLKGTQKPLCYGKAMNVPLVLVDRVNLIYQGHDGSLESFENVFDGALALINDGDVADIEATAAIANGHYITQLSGGYVRLGAEPEKMLTADMLGDNANGTTNGYVETAADIVERIVLNHSTLTQANINAIAFAAANVANNSPVGWAGNSGTVGQVISTVINSIGGAWVFNRRGELIVGVFKFGSPAGVIEEKDIAGIRRERTPTPSWSRQIGYARSYVVQEQNDVLASELPAAIARKDFVSTEYRVAIDEDAAIKTRRLLSQIVEVNTLLALEVDASAEAVRQQLIFGADRHIFAISTERQQFKYRAGQTITISYPIFGFEAGANVIILGIVENVDSRSTDLKVYV